MATGDRVRTERVRKSAAMRHAVDILAMPRDGESVAAAVERLCGYAPAQIREELQRAARMGMTCGRIRVLVEVDVTAPKRHAQDD
ncbi:MAG TPA: hypothetical protein PLZ36_13375 [Armatimonadota bacterium]|nr:hypothetical protein [Armatimonadota bacterium]HOS43674.1 hypothetical protein [Armatimonadota bacterium]